MTDDIDIAAKDKEQRLEERLRALGSVLVAYSGGVDSSYLAYVARRVLGDKMLAVTAVSPSLSEHQKQKAAEFAARFSIPHELVESAEFQREEYLANSPDRCYFCKQELFSILDRLARDRGYAAVAYGMNRDDTGDFRPGHRAATERGVASPLLDAQLGKDEIRRLSALHGLPTSDDPASPCLSSRIPFNQRIDLAKIRQVEKGEELLRSLGFLEMRIRHHGEIARIELRLEDLGRSLDGDIRRRISEGLHNIGFKYVTVDIDGFRTGSLSSGFKKA
ncbi:MAG: ATP-dependent sacrificial sulfur transferase LarE [Acidobacteriota bacterium]